MLKIPKLIAVGALAVGMVTGANASTVTINNDTDITDPASSGANGTNLRGTVTCTLACSGLFYTAGAYGFGDPGEMFDGPSNSGDANEALWVNSVLGTSFTGTDVGDNYQDDDDAFVSAALYIIMKVGNNPDYLMIRNDSGVSQTFSYAKASGSKGGLSHTFSLGTPPPSPVPLPAAGWLLLAGIAGMGAIRRRRKS